MSKIVSESDWESDRVSSSDEDPSFTDNVREHFGLLRLAPDPSEKYFKSDKKAKETPMNPQRHWEPQNFPVNNNGNLQVNNYPTRSREESGSYQRNVSVRPDTYQENRPSTSQGRKSIKKRSYHLSTFGEDGEEVLEEQAVNEDGFQVYHNVSYKKRMKRQKRQRQENLENAEDLTSMRRELTYRFLLTKVNPDLSVNSIERYLLNNFNIYEVNHIRKNPMTFPHYASFIFIINTYEELDIGEFETHDWPGEIRCFFAPRPRNNRD